jgi:hypothetical protein
MKITLVMKDCIAKMRAYNRMIDRYPGGFWQCGPTGGDSFGTSTVEALVTRGLAVYSEWQNGRRGRFPIRAILTSLADTSSESQS